MKLRVAHLFVLCPLAVIFATPAFAQADEAERFSIGVAGGITQTEIGNEPYWMASARFRAGYRTAGEERHGSVTGYVEPEIGYWSGTGNAPVNGNSLKVKERDTLLGVNVGGAVRLRSVEYFLGGGVGYHFLNRSLEDVAHVATGSSDFGDDNKVGVDAQFGFDLLMTETVSIFGVGRFDLVQDAPDASQGKAYVGVRFHF